MKKRILSAAALSACLLGGTALITGCDDETTAAILSAFFQSDTDYSSNAGSNYFGWFGNDEDTESIEVIVTVQYDYKDKEYGMELMESFPEEYHLNEQNDDYSYTTSYGEGISFFYEFANYSIMTEKYSGVISEIVKDDRVISVQIGPSFT